MKGTRLLTCWLFVLIPLFRSALVGGEEPTRPPRVLQATNVTTTATTITGILLIWATNELAPSKGMPNTSAPPIELQLLNVILANGTSLTMTPFVQVANASITDVRQLPSQYSHGTKVSVTGQLGVDANGVDIITVASLANVVVFAAASGDLSAPLQGAYKVLYTRVVLGGPCTAVRQPTLPMFFGNNTITPKDINGTSGLLKTVNNTWQSCSFGSIWADPSSRYQELTTGASLVPQVPPSPRCPVEPLGIINRCPNLIWLDLIRQYAELNASLNFPLDSNFGYHTIAFPNMNCSWIGRSTVRCYGSSTYPPCYTFMNGDYGKDSAVAIHEWGHTLNNAHGGQWLPSPTDPNAQFVPYAEFTTSMGSLGLFSVGVNSVGQLTGTAQAAGQGVAQCYNVVEQARLGWTLPWVLDNTSLPEGTAIRTTLPALSNTTNTGLQFNVETWNLDQPYPAYPTERVYMAYLLAEGGWSQVSTNYSNRVNVYRHGARLWTDYMDSAWVGAVPSGGTYVVSYTPRQLAPRLRLDVISTDPQVSKSAVVQVCRYAADSNSTACPSTATASIITSFVAYAYPNLLTSDGKKSVMAALATIPLNVSFDYLHVIHDQFCYTYNLQAPTSDKKPRGASFALGTVCPPTFPSCSAFFAQMTLTLYNGTNQNFTYPLPACDSNAKMCFAFANKVMVGNSTMSPTSARLCFNIPTPTVGSAAVGTKAGASVAVGDIGKVHAAQVVSGLDTSNTLPMQPSGIQSAPTVGKRRTRAIRG